MYNHGHGQGQGYCLPTEQCKGLPSCIHYGNTGCGVFKRGVQN